MLLNNFSYQGYYNDNDARKNAVDKDEWIITGDKGYFNEDGGLFVVERQTQF